MADEEKEVVETPAPTKKETKTKTSKRTPKKVSEVRESFEKRDDLKRLVFYVIIVNYGQSSNIIKLLKNNHSSAQFLQIGEGTATKQVRSILNIEDNTKEIIYSLLREEYVDDFKMELDAYFASSKRNAGIAFTIDLSTVVGVKMYKFLTQTVRG